MHSHDDGVIHWHPTGSRATGRNAQLEVFFDNYGVEISDTNLELPEGGFTVDGNPPQRASRASTKRATRSADGEDGRVTVVVWEDHRDPNSSQVYTSSFDDIPFDKNGLAITIAFVPDDVDVEMPPSAANLEELGALEHPAAGKPERPLPPSEVASTEPTGSTSRRQAASPSVPACRSSTTEGDDSEHR